MTKGEHGEKRINMKEVGLNICLMAEENYVSRKEIVVIQIRVSLPQTAKSGALTKCECAADSLSSYDLKQLDSRCFFRPEEGTARVGWVDLDYNRDIEGNSNTAFSGHQITYKITCE